MPSSETMRSTGPLTERLSDSFTCTLNFETPILFEWESESQYLWLHSCTRCSNANYDKYVCVYACMHQCTYHECMCIHVCAWACYAVYECVRVCLCVHVFISIGNLNTSIRWYLPIMCQRVRNSSHQLNSSANQTVRIAPHSTRYRCWRRSLSTTASECGIYSLEFMHKHILQ